MQLDNTDTFVSLSGSTLRKELVEAAIRAPSGDNCQPWHFRFGNSRLEIDLLPDRAESFFDFRHRGSLLSIGAVVENIRVRAACMGLAAMVSYPSGELLFGVPAVGVSLRRGAPADERCRARLIALRDRTVNRRPFLPIRIDSEKQRAWTAESIEGPEVRIIEQRREVGRWARLTYLGDRIRWTHPTIHRELFANIRFSRAEAERKRVGLEIDRLGAGPTAALIMRWLQPWARMVHLCRYGIDGALANQTRALAFCAGALVLVTIKSNEPAQWIRAGEQVQRLWIMAHQQGLCVQPLPVAMYLDQRFQEEGAANFLPRHRPLLEEMRSGLSELLANRVGAMLYRVGYGWRMSHPALRLPAESFYDALKVA
jgi:nitroreductase